MADVQSIIALIKALQGALLTLRALDIPGYHFPADTATIDLLPSYDHIVIGGGTAGCVLASRLSEDANNTVLLIEAGATPPVESMLPGMFPLLPNSGSDWNQTSVSNGWSAQNLVENFTGMTAGHMLGGSSGLDHMIYDRGNPLDFGKWVNITGDDSWSYTNLVPYLIKCENVRDEVVVKDNQSYYGTGGPLYLKKQHNPRNIPIINAFEELNNNMLTDTKTDTYFDFVEPLLAIYDGIRCSSPIAYLSRAKNRTNLHIKSNTIAKKILFDSKNTATGVEILDSENVTKIIREKKEIIISAGAIRTPQLLTLSGIGVKEQLNKLGIEVVTELPVGQNLVDHHGAVAVYPLGKTNTTTVANYHEYPVPMTVGTFGLNSSEYPFYQAVNLVYHRNSTNLLYFCRWVLRYNENICQKMYNANLENDLLLVVIYILQPYSRGQVKINSTDPSVNPTVELGLLSDERDRFSLAQSLMNFSAVLNTTYFKSLNSTMLDLNLTDCSSLDKSTFEYYKCYIEEMSISLWHYCCTCPMGTVLNSDLTVKNTTNLRVVDASAMPYTTRAKIMSTVYALAEKAADMIMNTTSE